MNEKTEINNRLADPSASSEEKSKKITIPRGPEPTEEKYDLIWPKIAMDEFESAKQTIVNQLRSQIKLLASSRGTKIATDAEVRDVLRQIVVGHRQSIIIRISRMATIFAVLTGGAMLSRGMENDDPLLTGVGVGLAIILTAFQELLLHFKR